MNVNPAFTPVKYVMGVLMMNAQLANLVFSFINKGLVMKYVPKVLFWMSINKYVLIVYKDVEIVKLRIHVYNVKNPTC